MDSYVDRAGVRQCLFEGSLAYGDVCTSALRVPAGCPHSKLVRLAAAALAAGRLRVMHRWGGPKTMSKTVLP